MNRDHLTMTCPTCAGRGKLRANLGARITFLRDQWGVGVYELERQLGLHRNVVWRIERGDTLRPDVYVVAKIAAHFGVTTGQLLGAEALDITGLDGGVK